MDFIRFNVREIFDLTILFYTIPVTEKKRRRGGKQNEKILDNDNGGGGSDRLRQ